MDLLRQLSYQDIISISKLASITHVYEKDVQTLINEIDSKRSVELSENVKKYFIRENISKSLKIHNQKMNIKLNDKQCAIKNMVLNNPKILEVKDANVILDDKVAIKISTPENKLFGIEYTVYTYVIPFLYYSNMTFNVLVPINTGSCKVGQIVSDNNFRKITNGMDLNSTLLYVSTPSINDSLWDISLKPNYDLYYYTFQIIYTLAGFGKLGLIQNDLHTKNILVKKGAQQRVKFVVDETTSYNVSVKDIPMIYDFDYAGMDNPISGILGSYNLKNKNDVPGICEALSVCNDADGGRRDMFVFLVRHMFQYKNSTNYRKYYDDLLELIIFMANGKVKLFFQNIRNNTYIPNNPAWKRDYRRRTGKDPQSDSEWIFDLVYRNKIPECPLQIPLDNKTMLSPLELLKSDTFKQFVSQTNKISDRIVTTTEISIDITKEEIDREHKRFMKENFRS